MPPGNIFRQILKSEVVGCGFDLYLSGIFDLCVTAF